MRPVIVAGNWKMNTLPAEAGALAGRMAAAMDEPEVVRIVCPPSISLSIVADALAGTGVEVGAQDVHAETSGAFTGDHSAAMVAAYASWSIVGHSERRRDHGETDAQVGWKLIRCAEAGLRPILCVGEQLREREAGTAIQTVRDQLRGALRVPRPSSDGGPVAVEVGEAAVGLPTGLVIAYEPVWAIGTGRTARGADAAEMADAIRETVAELAGPDLARDLPVLYGGSVTSAAIGEFLVEPAIDGALVGGASLKVDEMAGIVARAALTARGRREAVARP